MQLIKNLDAFNIINTVDYFATFVFYLAQIVYFDKMHTDLRKRFWLPKYFYWFVVLIYPLIILNQIFGMILVKSEAFKALNEYEIELIPSLTIEEMFNPCTRTADNYGFVYQLNINLRIISLGISAVSAIILILVHKLNY